MSCFFVPCLKNFMALIVPVCCSDKTVTDSNCSRIPRTLIDHCVTMHCSYHFNTQSDLFMYTGLDTIFILRYVISNHTWKQYISYFVHLMDMYLNIQTSTTIIWIPISYNFLYWCVSFEDTFIHKCSCSN